MAASEHTVEVQRGSQRQDRFSEYLDPDNRAEVRRVLHNWLEDEGIDRGLWHRYSITVLTSSRLVEVRA